MSKHREPSEALNASALTSISTKIRFEDCDFTTAETQQLLACGTTTLFYELIRTGELESYVRGARRIITGRSILAYRERKLAEARLSARGSRGAEQLRKARRAADKAGRKPPPWSNATAAEP